MVVILILGTYIVTEITGTTTPYVRPEHTAGMVGEVSFEILPPDQPTESKEVLK